MIDIVQIHEVLTRIAPTVDWATVSEDESLEAAGLDSLDKASLFLELETLSGEKIPDDHYDKIDTISAMRDYLSA